MVEGCTPEAIQEAIIEHSGLIAPVEPSLHRVAILRIDPTRHALIFEPAIPPYAFTNLIGWLDDPQMTSGSSGASGWLVSPGSGIRYYLKPERSNAGGDTLVGVGENGDRVSVYLPDCSLKQREDEVANVPEPELAGLRRVVAFDVTVDGDTSFGNPQFA